jgi:hypothetical protein
MVTLEFFIAATVRHFLQRRSSRCFLAFISSLRSQRRLLCSERDSMNGQSFDFFLCAAHLFFMAALIRALPSALMPCLPPRVPATKRTRPQAMPPITAEPISTGSSTSAEFELGIRIAPVMKRLAMVVNMATVMLSLRTPSDDALRLPITILGYSLLIKPNKRSSVTSG